MLHTRASRHCAAWLFSVFAACHRAINASLSRLRSNNRRSALWQRSCSSKFFFSACAYRNTIVSFSRRHSSNWRLSCNHTTTHNTEHIWTCASHFQLWHSHSCRHTRHDIKKHKNIMNIMLS